MQERIYLTVNQTRFEFNTKGDTRRHVKRTIHQDQDGFYIIYRGSRIKVHQVNYIYVLDDGIARNRTWWEGVD